MKKDVHPQYFPDATITCSCKNVVFAGATMQSQHVEICSACHPFFTGKSKLIDSAGRVHQFQKRRKTAEEAKEKKQSKSTKAAA